MNNSIILAAALAMVGGYAFAETGEGSENPEPVIVCNSDSAGCEEGSGENGEGEGGEQAGDEEGSRGEGGEGGGEGDGESEGT